MSSSARFAVLGVVVFVGGLAAARAEAQVLAKTLLFNTVKPCRVADTRSAAAGILVGGTQRTFNVVGAATNYTTQGGVAGGCGIPGFASGSPQVQAVAINVLAVDPSGDGFLTAWPSDQTLPLASTVNFQKLVPNLNIANGVIVPVRQDVQGGDITIVAGVSNAHVIIDVVGYFSKAELRKYYLTPLLSPVTGGNALTACASGYHMASLWEIFDTSNLSYNTALGFTNNDAGFGPPGGVQGWIRTGNTSQVLPIAGAGNCNAWASSNAADSGSYVSAGLQWAAAATTVSPWNAGFSACNVPRTVWCVAD